MRKPVFIGLFVFCVCLSWAVESVAPLGSGTSGSPYQIATVDNLYWLSQTSSVWGNFFIQTANIDASDIPNWDPVGNWDTHFSGEYNGNGYLISNLTINKEGLSEIGMFGVSSGSTLKQINLRDVYVVGLNDVGALCGIALNSTSIIRSSSSGEVFGRQYVGGLIGLHMGGSLLQYSYSEVTTNAVAGSSDYKYFGGLVGTNWNNGGAVPIIHDCYSRGTVFGSNGTSYLFNSFSGENQVADIYRCFATGVVMYNSAVLDGSGFVRLLSGTCDDNYFDKETTQTEIAGGATGKTSAEMKHQATFANWDFVNVWAIDPTINDGYPYLISNEPESPLPVTLSSFTGCMDAGLPQLAWTTQSETGNVGWNIYRAESDAIADAVLLTSSLIAGAGTTSEPTDYMYTDEEAVDEGMVYFYWLESISCSGQSETWGPVSIEIPIGNEEPNTPQIPVETGVSNYPNPFNPSTAICLTLAESDCDAAQVAIYNSRGQLVKRLQAQRTAGEAATYSVMWDGCDAAGKTVSSGVYLTRIQAGNTSLLHKMVMMK